MHMPICGTTGGGKRDDKETIREGVPMMRARRDALVMVLLTRMGR